MGGWDVCSGLPVGLETVRPQANPSGHSTDRVCFHPRGVSLCVCLCVYIVL